MAESNLAKQFLSLQKGPVAKARVTKLLNDVKKAPKSKFTKQLKQKLQAILDFMAEQKGYTCTVELADKDFVKQCKQKAKSVKSGQKSASRKSTSQSKNKTVVKEQNPLAGFGNVFVAANNLDKVQLQNAFQLPGAIGEFLGEMERNKLAILLKGDAGAGKTRFSMRLANAFAQKGMKVAYNTLEISKQSMLVMDMAKSYIDAKNQSSVFFNDEQNHINEIRKQAECFDVVMIDSWQKIEGVNQQSFDQLRIDYPKTIFVVIFQLTTSGTARGGSASAFDASVVLHVVKVDNTFENNYVETLKNRYAHHELVYNIHKNQLQEAP